MRRIAVACRWLDGFGGTTTGILERARRFSKAGWEVHCLGERLDEARIREAGAVPRPVWGLPFGGGLRRRFFAWTCDRAVRRGAFDLVEGHGDGFSQDVLVLHNCVHAAHEAIEGKPLPAGSTLGRLHERMLRENRFKSLIANSELMKRDLVSRFGVPAEKIQVVYPGHDPAKFRREDKAALRGPMRRELGVADDEILVGLITSGDFKKRGVDILLAALEGLPGKARGLVVGKGSSRTAERVIFLPAAPDVERLYHALDVFAYPALYEEFGQSVQEAMACGVPVLTSRRVGAGELLGRAGGEILLERPDDGAFAERLAELVAQAELRRKFAERGVAAVAGNDWDRNFERTLALYEPLLQNKV